MESIYRLGSNQVPQLIFHPLSRQSYTCKDQMNENTKHFSIYGALDCQYGKDGKGRGCP